VFRIDSLLEEPEAEGGQQNTSQDSKSVGITVTSDIVKRSIPAAFDSLEGAVWMFTSVDEIEEYLEDYNSTCKALADHVSELD
jgi:hypothetical protein